MMDSEVTNFVNYFKWVICIGMSLGGIFTILCASLNLRFFMDHPKARNIVRKRGESGARLYYVFGRHLEVDGLR